MEPFQETMSAFFQRPSLLIATAALIKSPRCWNLALLRCRVQPLCRLTWLLAGTGSVVIGMRHDGKTTPLVDCHTMAPRLVES